MKILQCINSLCSGGAEVFACSLAIAQKKKGHDVYFFAYAGAIDEKGKQLELSLQKAQITYITPSIKNNWMKPFIPFILARQLRLIQPAVVHCHLEQSDFFMWIAAKLATTKAIMVRTIHSVYVPKILPRFIHRQLARFYAGAACSAIVEKTYSFLGDSQAIINNGMDLESLTSTISRNKIRSSLGFKEDTIVLLNIGSFGIRDGQLPKGQDIIVHALNKLEAANVVTVFLGDGDARKEINKLATVSGVSDKCIFAGKVTNPIDYIYAADAVLMPSRFEGMSISCIEAVCAGSPIVVSDIPAFEPFLRTSTIVVNHDSPLSLAKGINLLLANINQYRAAAKSEQAYYQSEFCIETAANHYLDFYRTTAAKIKNSPIT